MIESQSFPAADLARNTGDILDAASRSPVTITKHRKPRFVLMSYERYASMTGETDQQVHTLADMPDDLKASMLAALEHDLAQSEDRDGG